MKNKVYLYLSVFIFIKYTHINILLIVNLWCPMCPQVADYEL